MSLDTLINNVSKKLIMSEDKSFDLVKKVTESVNKDTFTVSSLESKGINKDEILKILETFKEEEFLTHQYQCFCKNVNEPEIYESMQETCEFCEQPLKNRFVHEISDVYSLKEDIIKLVREKEKLILETSLSEGFITIYEELKGKIHNVVPFLGAGISIPLGLDSWGQLLAEMKNEILGDQNKGRFDRYLEKGNYLRALTFLKTNSFVLSEDKAIKDRIIQRIKTKYNKNTDEHLHNIKDIINLNAPFYITTNYDLALTDFKNGDVYPYTLRQIDNLQDLLNDGKQIVLHLHGHIKDKDSMIVTEEDYNELYNKPNIKSFLSGIMGSKHLLFIGFSFKDEYFNNIFEDVFKNIGGNNYIIMPNLYIEDAQDLMQKGLRPISINVPLSENDEEYKRNYVNALKVVLNNLIE
ncbi:SIR2 family protein [Priestia megaterium]|uniref:SIR2 family protein n=1 Tax=Priestia megaterium TaxID=1404 RepID=UPI0027302105|nr:SIR2 family protein [Priestia megaterium]MDP1383615.1 SIR2 family protein [Priestia megaterium]MDP1427766.1 SIR2 family protein [Priestia megaterium]